MRQVLLGLLGLALLGGCSIQLPGFLGSSRQQAEAAVPAAELEPRVLPLRNAVAERGLRGVIINVEGLAPTQGFHTATLVPLNEGLPDAAGVIAYELRATPPAIEGAQGPEPTRLVLAAAFVSEGALRGVRGFRVNGTPLPLPGPAR